MMDFRDVKQMCKYAGPGVICPQNFKNCNSDNCPLAIQSIIDESDCERYCPIIDKYRTDVRRFRVDYQNADEARKQIEKAYRERAFQYEQIETEAKTAIDASMGVLNGILYDLKDKLNTTLKRLEP